MGLVIEIIRSIRNARAQYNVESGKWIEAQIYGGPLTPVIAAQAEAIETLARTKPVTFTESRQGHQPDENTLVLVLQEAEVVIPMESMVDLEAEKKRLEKELEQSEAEAARLEARLIDKNFLSKAPESVVEKERQKSYAVMDRIERLRQQLKKY